jgi:hypothetical protein
MLTPIATGRTRVIRKVVPTDSFFNFFKPPQPPTPEQLENAELEEEELDYQLGEDFKEKIIPRAVDFFTGKALEYEDDMEEFDEEFDDEDDFEDDDEVRVTLARLAGWLAGIRRHPSVVSLSSWSPLTRG